MNRYYMCTMYFKHKITNIYEFIYPICILYINTVINKRYKNLCLYDIDLAFQVL